MQTDNLTKIDAKLLPWLKKHELKLLSGKDSREFETKNGRKVKIYWGTTDPELQPAGIMLQVYIDGVLNSEDSVTSIALFQDLEGIIKLSK